MVARSLALLCVLACVVHADTLRPPPTLWVGGQIDLIPFVRFEDLADSVPGPSESGFEAILDYRVSPILTIGVAPRVVLGVHPNGSFDRSIYEFDLRGRITLGGQVSDDLRVHSITELGYSSIENNVRLDCSDTYLSSRGVVFGEGVGMVFRRLMLEMSYQWGHQSVGGIHPDPHQLTVGIGLLFGVN
jgi:hypothetical protein